jgi:adenylate cyclase
MLRVRVIEAAKRLIRPAPEFPMIYRWPAAALGQLGRTTEAREWLLGPAAVSETSVPLAFRDRRIFRSPVAREAQISDPVN